MTTSIAAKAFLLFLLTTMARGALAEAEVDKTACSERCDRLFTRSLDRIKMDSRRIEAALTVRKKIDHFKDVCWKFEDFEDCHRQCEHPKSAFFSSEAMRKNLFRKCRPIVKREESHFKCISKYHSFLEIRCSTYAKEATSLREKSKGHDKYRQETCRHLHYHNRCLTNNIFQYCPQAKHLFNRFTLREFFLSFVVPSNDDLFSDSFLDFCQIFDFAKMAQEIYDSTSTARSGEGPGTTFSASEREETSTERPKFTSRLFSPYEDLADSPPNFHYSSQRSQQFAKTTQPYKLTGNASEIHHYDREDSMKAPNVEIEIVTHPVTVHFGADGEMTTTPTRLPSSAEEEEDPLAFFPEESAESYGKIFGSLQTTTPVSSKTTNAIDANRILSTIMKFPNIFPTKSPTAAGGIGDDPHREIAEILAGIDEEVASQLTTRLPSSTGQSTPSMGFGRPYLSGTKVHIKPIRRWNEPDPISDEEGALAAIFLVACALSHCQTDLNCAMMKSDRCRRWSHSSCLKRTNPG
ncbi:hypothetical protein L596_007620 [Steinernema carpocapsae]|uniref:Chondroitin proteoglycan 4 domain-containing protein n=1 Tax=Steinernema carpocapsae TaxID=34508 RepID=A0A4U5P9W3_STECR|nr:hypothetical protein L596_007620 [Steinernema carpocapsae]